mmetsp:Transcript_103559/g.302227  ORF Transcript_103559/g.302227 Transcript_103559/m.302227 type:complete len:214 (-) Transcript_103559:11-652(-)
MWLVIPLLSAPDQPQHSANHEDVDHNQHRGPKDHSSTPEAPWYYQDSRAKAHLGDDDGGCQVRRSAVGCHCMHVLVSSPPGPAPSLVCRLLLEEGEGKARVQQLQQGAVDVAVALALGRALSAHVVPSEASRLRHVPQPPQVWVQQLRPRPQGLGRGGLARRRRGVGHLCQNGFSKIADGLILRIRSRSPHVASSVRINGGSGRSSDAPAGSL